MKTLLIAAAAVLVAAPAFAQEAANAAATAKPASVTAPAAKKTFEVGKRIPGNYVATSQYLVRNWEELGLAKPVGSRWIKIGDTAYRVDSRNDLILETAPVKQ